MCHKPNQKLARELAHLDFQLDVESVSQFDQVIHLHQPQFSQRLANNLLVGNRLVLQVLPQISLGGLQVNRFYLAPE